LKFENKRHVPLREIKRAVANVLADEGGTRRSWEEDRRQPFHRVLHFKRQVEARAENAEIFQAEKITVFVPADEPKESN